jgi:hypothetical protein
MSCMPAAASSVRGVQPDGAGRAITWFRYSVQCICRARCFRTTARQQLVDYHVYLSCRRQPRSVGLFCVESAAVRLEPLEHAACIDRHTG